MIRQSDPDDRRAQRIGLTKAGEEALAISIPHVMKVLEQTVHTALNDEEVETSSTF